MARTTEWAHILSSARCAPSRCAFPAFTSRPTSSVVPPLVVAPAATIAAVSVVLTRARHACTKRLQTPLHSSAVGAVADGIVARTLVDSAARAASYLAASGGVAPKAPTWYSWSRTVSPDAAALMPAQYSGLPLAKRTAFSSSRSTVGPSRREVVIFALGLPAFQSAVSGNVAGT